MRLLRLDLLAFGSFDNRVLDLTASAPTLHLVYGPNEAGKSTVLRALHALLFGFPERTSDDFRIPATQLRVGALLEAADGRQLELVRRKGRKLTLANPAGERFSDDVLTPLLGTVDEAAFRRLFGLDGERLREGADELQSVRGEVGQSLFEAGSGAIGLRRRLHEIESRAAELFSPRGEKPLLNLALLDLAEARRATREDSLSGARWRALCADLEAAEQDERRLHDERLQRSAELARFERVRRTQAALARRRWLQAELAELIDAPDLPEDANEEREAAERRRDHAASTLAGLERRASAAQLELARIVVPEDVLRERAAIESQIEEIGTSRKHASDLPKREGELAGIERESRELLRALWPKRELADADALRRPRTELLRVRTLAGKSEQLASEHAQLAQHVTTTRTRILHSEAQLAGGSAGRDLRRLEIALADVQARALHEDERLRLLADVSAQRATLLRDAMAMVPDGVDAQPEALAGLRVPARETIDRMAADELRLRQALTRDADALARAESQQRDLAHQLADLAAAGPIPSQASLGAAREQRDALWRLLRRGFIDGHEDVAHAARALDPDHPPAEAFERALLGSDEIADALAADSARVARAGQLANDLETAIVETTGAQGACAAARDAIAGWESVWRDAWRESGIEPRSPTEMDGWLRERAQLVARLEALERREAEAATQTARSEHSRLATIAALHELGETIDDDAAVAAVVARSQYLIESEAVASVERRTRQSRIDEWRQELPDVEARLARSERALASARATWAEALAPFGLGPEATPTEANDVLDRLEAFFQLRSKADELAHRIAGMQRDLALRTREVASLCGAIAPDLSGRPHAEQANALKDRLAAATQAALRRTELGDTLQQLADEQASALRDHEQAETELAGLRRLAGASDDDALRRALQRADRKRQTRAELAQLEQSLTTAEARTPDELELESAQIDLDALPERIDQLDRALAQHATQTTAATERRTTLASERTRYETASGAQGAEQRAQEALARIELHAEEWTRLRLAAHVLRETIERYRQINQAPILARMSELLPVLTGNAFRAVEVMLEDDDTPVLAGVRASGERVGVDGMSEGTRDQLFLALRLAAIERHLDAHGAMPIVLDDVLVHFDDTRARPALQLLAGLAQRTQVLCFTHHEHLVTLAREEIPARRLVVHTL